MNSLLEPSEEELQQPKTPYENLTDNSQKSHYENGMSFCFSLLFFILESKPETAEKAENTLSLGKKIAILCRDQSDITIIKDLFGDEPLSTTVHIFSGSDAGAGAEFLLSTHSMRSCFIVVEAKTMKEEQFQDKPAGTPYENLLRTARKTVGKNIRDV